MLRHSDIWQGIDRLAAENGLTASGLARRAGLDPTTFNKSKRVTREGKARWPSTESISKILDATGASIGDFVECIGGGDALNRFRRFPVIGFAQAGAEGFFDDAGYPVGGGWDEVPFPEIGDPHSYALEINGDSMEPVYRDGDLIVVSPSSGIRRGDRIVVRTRNGEVMAKMLRRRTARRWELQSFNIDHGDRTVLTEDLDWAARIVWASQ